METLWDTRRRPGKLGPWAVFAAALLASAWTTALRAADPPAPAGVITGAEDGGDLHVRTSRSLPDKDRIVTLTAEIESLQVVSPGKAVDVQMVTIDSHGKIAGATVMKNLKVKSVQAAPAHAKRIDGDEKYPIKSVALIVEAGKVETLRAAASQGMLRLIHSKTEASTNLFASIGRNFVTNLFQPLLLFFFMGFAVPLLKVPFEFPKAFYQALTIYLLVAIGWHGGVLMAGQNPAEFAVAGGFIVVGFITNFLIGVAATIALRKVSRVRRIDAVTVGAYYGSDSAGTFVTCLGILSVLGIAHDSYMPVMLAVMEIPGCLVGLFLVSRLRRQGMDIYGNMPDDPDYNPDGVRAQAEELQEEQAHAHAHASAGGNGSGTATATLPKGSAVHQSGRGGAGNGHGSSPGGNGNGLLSKINWKIMHEVFLNPGLFLLFGGILVGFVSGRQALEDPHVIEDPDHLFVFLFKGALCLFLLEMGMTACKHLKDLKTAGPGYVLFGLFSPVVFATTGMVVMHVFSMAIGHPFQLGSYALFSVLCAAASYIAVPAVQRLAIPEASPTLPLAASLGLTFSFNVTLGIPIYLEIAKLITRSMPVT